jgi:hypothetical protein
LEFAENLKLNEKEIAKSLRFSELPFSFLQQHLAGNLFDVYGKLVSSKLEIHLHFYVQILIESTICFNFKNHAHLLTNYKF